MVQLSDLANFFESVRNFYEWRKPYRTATALALLTLSILLCIFIPTWLLQKSVSFSIGFTFFALWPIYVNLSEYRLLVSPAKRFLWNIPTHGEWAVRYLQAEGRRVCDAGAVDRDKADLAVYTAHYAHTPGHLILSPSHLRFVSQHPLTTHFELAYDRIQSLQKENRIVKQNVPRKLVRDGGMDLRITCERAGQGRETEIVFKDMDRRDEAFSQIVGFSDTTWQIVW